MGFTAAPVEMPFIAGAGIFMIAEGLYERVDMGPLLAEVWVPTA
jgi:hypothetical protein